MGAVYMVALTSVHGHPIEEFLVDPPVSLDRYGLGHLAPVGVHLVEQGGKQMVVDRVGLEHYPDVAGFVEEAKRSLGKSMLGISRRINRNFPFRRLVPGTLLYLAHNKALICNPDKYLEAEPNTDQLPGCPRIVGWEHCRRLGSISAAYAHKRGGSDYNCARLWYQDVTQFRMPPGKGANERAGFGVVADTVFAAMAKPRTAKAWHQPGIFMRVPFRLEVVRDTEAGTHEEAMKAARESELDVTLVDE